MLLTADYAGRAEAGKLNIMGVFTEIQALGFPATHGQMVIVAKLLPTPAELGSKKVLNIKLMDEDGYKTLVDFRREFEVKSTDEGRIRTHDQILKIQNLIFQHPGTYQISVLVDGDEKGSTPLQLVQVTKPAEPVE